MRGRDLHRILVDAGVLEHAHWFELTPELRACLRAAALILEHYPRKRNVNEST